MRNRSIIVLVTVAAILSLIFSGTSGALSSKASFTISNPHKNYAYNYKGNLHAHSSLSGATGSPAEVGQWYKDNGYDFYALTDIVLAPDPGIAGITWLGTSQEELSSPGHFGHINISTLINSGTTQEKITNALNQGGFSIFYHPAWILAGHSAEEMINQTGAVGLEAINGLGIDSTGLWDLVLTSGKVIWGTASDDTNNESNRGTAYIIVNSSSATADRLSILEQIKAGNFYGSMGFDLRISVSGRTIHASTTNGSKIRWIKSLGRTIKTTAKQADSYTPTGLEKYVRVEILSSSGTAMAWSQPLFVSGDNYRPKTYAPKRASARRRRGVASAKLYWKVYDPLAGGKAYVKLAIKKKIKRGKKTSYKLVKLVNYRLTSIGKTRVYRWKTKFPGTYRFYVLAKDRTGNSQQNSARNWIVIR
ncbi:MAG: hypothetical protein C4562_05445 [Actinobacteria bacterium]|nr:MAG: hypothetical protein C4562_05445 [Actinomycetota bacterium]